MSGTSRGEREVVHLRVPHFFTTIEQQDDPGLAGRPVVVGAGVVSGCSPETADLGVCPGMVTAEARRRCPGLAVVPERPSRYERASDRLRELCREFSPAVEAASLGTFFLDLSHVPAGQRDGLRRRLLGRIHDEMGVGLLLGAGSGRLVAQVASGQAIPGEPCVVPIGQERAFLAPQGVRVLPEMTEAIARRLERYNVTGVGELAAVPVELLRQLFGGAGERLHRYARGIDPRPVSRVAHPDSVRRWLSFAAPVADQARLRAALDRLLGQAAHRMRSLDLAAGGLTVTVQYSDEQVSGGRCRFRGPTRNDTQLRLAAQGKFRQVYCRRLPLLLVAVVLTSLGPDDRQAGLFDEPHTL